MKTYSRKKNDNDKEQEIIIDLNDVCRLCMNTEDELISIYDNDEPVPLTLRIMACVALEVFEGDGLPDKVCSSCKLQLEKSYSFRKKCEQSDMKLRQHLREIKQNDAENEMVTEVEESTMEEVSQEDPSTVDELVGVTKVTYIQQDLDTEEIDPENITLPPPTDDSVREACTIRTEPEENMSKTKTETEIEDDSVYILPASEEDNALDGHNMDAIADVVKATLANQTGLNITGQLQMKISRSSETSTQVEVTTEDGSVIVMELMAEDEVEDSSNDLKLEDPEERSIFQCPLCPKSFSRRIQLKRHASVHMEQRGFSCGICEKWFPTRSALVRHERIHTGERPFQCEVCQKSFAQKEILFRHLMTHSGQKPYNCPHCEKGFSQKESLRIHMRSHAAAKSPASTDLQLHYCSLCPKVFCHASGLSRHLITHTGKTFKCSYCDKAFTDKSSLRRHHLQTNHEI